MCDHADFSSDMTLECLRFYDELRVSPANVLAATSSSSHVVRIVNDKTYRLCHLASMLPSTYDGKNLQANFGLITEAAGMLAMIDFNNRNNEIVPDLARIKDCNVRLTMEFQDTQFSPIEASRILTQDILLRSHSLETPQPISMVGATRSAVTGPLAVLGGIHELPIVSYGSTSSQLDHVDAYPYFGRSVPTNAGDAVATVSYLRNVLGVTHCGCIFVKDGYGLAFHEEFIRAGRLLDPPMNVASAPYDPNNQESIASAVETLRRSQFTFIFGIISTPTYNAVMKEAYSAGVAGVPGIAWFLSGSSGQLLSDDFGLDASTEADIAAATNGVGLVSLDISDNDAFMASWSALESNPFLKEYFVSKHDPALDFTDFTFPETPTYWESLQYDAVMALGLAACDAKDEFFTGPSLFDTFVGTSFQGASGFVQFDESTGTRDYSSLSYKVTNVVARSPNAQNKITFSSTRTSYLNEAQWTQVAPFVYSDGTTIQPPPPGLPPLEMDLNLIDKPARIVGLTLSAIVMAGSMGFALWTIIRKKSVVVRLTQPFFLSMICIGTFLMGAAIIFMSFQEPVSKEFLDIACMTAPWLLSLGFVIAFSALLSKTLRINKLVNQSGGFRRVVVRVQDVLIPFLVLLTLNCVILVSWTVVDPLRWTRIEGISSDQYGRSIESYGTCRSEDSQLQLVFYVLIAIVDISSLLFANAANYRARHISRGLHEAGSITLSAAIMMEATLIGIPALLVVGDIPTASFIMRSTLVTVFCAAILLPLFIPKIIQARQDGYRTRGMRIPGNESVPARSVVMGSTRYLGESRHGSL